MPNLSIRGLDEDTTALLKRRARKSGRSVNAEVIDLVRHGLGLSDEPRARGKCSDLDHLAGTWSRHDAEAFERKIAPFEAIDEELWR